MERREVRSRRRCWRGWRLFVCGSRRRRISRSSRRRRSPSRRSSSSSRGRSSSPTSPATNWSIRRSGSSASRTGRKARPVQQQFLSLYPGYTEPNVEVIVDGTPPPLSRAAAHVRGGGALRHFARRRRRSNLAELATLPFVERIDPAIKHQLDRPRRIAMRPSDPRAIHNQHPQRKWCEGRAVVICLHSSYKLEGRLPVGIQLANKLREGSRRISDTLEFDSELTVLSPAEVAELGLAKLTGLDTPPVGALEQSIFYVNQVMQFGKLLAVFQAHPSDPEARPWSASSRRWRSNRTCSSKQKQYAKVPVLRNLVPAQVLAGQKLVQHRQVAQRRAAGLCPQPDRAIAAILESEAVRRPASRRTNRACAARSRPRTDALKREIPRFFGPFCLDFAAPRRYIPRTFRQAVSFACSERHTRYPAKSLRRQCFFRRRRAGHQPRRMKLKRCL